MRYEEPTLFDTDVSATPVIAPPPQPRPGYYKLLAPDPEQYCDHCTTLFAQGGPVAARRRAVWLRISPDHRARLMLCDGHADLVRADDPQGRLMSAASLPDGVGRSPRMPQPSLPALRFRFFRRRKLRAWYRRVLQRYWRLAAERDELARTVAHLEIELAELRDLLAVANGDLARQRTQHTADLALLGQRTRALRDVTKICEQGRAAGVTAVNIDKVAAAAERGTW